jgi:hypothetical protein
LNSLWLGLRKKELISEKNDKSKRNSYKGSFLHTLLYRVIPTRVEGMTSQYSH